MDKLQGLAQRLCQNMGITYKPMTVEEIEASYVQEENSRPGNLTGYDCPKCLNRGYSMVLENGISKIRDCECMKTRESIRLIQESGIGEVLERCTFDSYITTEPWQKSIKEKAMDFVEHHGNSWFFVGGQVGCGKTHLCTAVVKGFLDKQVPCRYIVWKEKVRELNANVNNDIEYNKIMDKLKRVTVLYIDDFFKTVGEQKISGPEAMKAFELLNYRYNNRDLITIISSEKSIEEIIDIDQAVGSRIMEQSRDYCFNVSEETGRNYRLRDCSNGR